MPHKRSLLSDLDLDVLLAVGDDAPSLNDKCRLVQNLRAHSPEQSSQLDRFLLDTVAQQRHGLLASQEGLIQGKAILDQLRRPPWRPAVYLGAVSTAYGHQALVFCDGARRLVSLDEAVPQASLTIGDEIFLNHELNVVMAKSPRGVLQYGETAIVERRLPDGRLLLKWRDEEVIVEAGPLQGETVQRGDQVRWDRTAWLAFEKIEHVRGHQFLLDEVADVRRDQIGGQEKNLETLLSSLTTSLVDPGKAATYGLGGRQSILLVGPPGCGKTLITRFAVAEVARLSGQRCRFAVVKPAEWESPYVGETQQNIRHCFQALREAAHDGFAVLFLDEVEAVGRVRGDVVGHHSDKFLAALLAELDGFTDRAGIAIVAATNRKDLVDPALMERLSDVEIPINRPDRRAAEAIFAIHLPESLPYSPNGAAAPATRQELIETAVARLYSPNAENELCVLRFRDGKTRTVVARELASGRLFSQVARAGRQAAFLREVRGGTPGLQVADIEDAVADAIERLRSTLTVHNVHAYLSDLPQDVDVVSVEPIVRKLKRPRQYHSM
jgi:hypothetical protein